MESLVLLGVTRLVRFLGYIFCFLTLPVSLYSLLFFLISSALAYELAKLIDKASHTTAYCPCALAGIGVALCYYFGASRDAVGQTGLGILLVAGILGGLAGARFVARAQKKREGFAGESARTADEEKLHG